MKIIIKLMLLTCLCAGHTQTWCVTPFASHLLITILDDSEPSTHRNEIKNNQLTTNLGASASELWAALLEEKTIIIVNSSVVGYLMEYIGTFKDAAQEEVRQEQAMIKAFNDAKNNEALQKELGKKKFDTYLDFFKLSKSITPSNWIKKSISDSLYILIPKNYASTLAAYGSFQKMDFSKIKFTAEELTLGIKLKKHADISDENFIKASYHKKKYAEHKRRSIIEATKYQEIIDYNLSWVSDHFIKSLNDIFITKKEYQQSFSSLTDILPRFVIITSGHGSPYKSIREKISELQEHQGPKVTQKIQRLEQLYAKGKRGYTGGQISGFNSKDFGNFITFCQNNLLVKLLFLNTCYGAEVNIHEALLDIAEDITGELPQLSLSFPLISGAFSTAGAYSISAFDRGTYTSTLTEGKKITKTMTYVLPKVVIPQFQSFLNTLNTKQQPDHTLYIDALQHIYSLYTATGLYNNIPMIKEGSQPWQPLLEQGTYITLGQKEVLQQVKQPLVVSPKVKLIFPDVFNIPFPLHIPHAKMPAFISKTPGSLGHIFAEIKAPIKFSEFITSFFKIPDLADTKAFLIKQLEILGKDNVPTTLTNVLLISHAQNRRAQQIVFFEAKGEHYYINDVATMNYTIQKKLYEKELELSGNKTMPHNEKEKILKELPATIFAELVLKVTTPKLNEIKKILAQLPQPIDFEAKPSVPVTKPSAPAVAKPTLPNTKSLDALAHGLKSVRR